MKKRLPYIGVLLGVTALLSAGCVSQTEAGPTDAATTGDVEAVTVTSERDASPDEWCGDKPLKIGHVVGFGGNTWRTIQQEVIEQEVLKCPAVDPDVLYASADGDLQKGTSDINAMVSQGVNVLLVYPDFGPAQLPALKAATDAGVIVVPYNAEAGGQLGVDYTASITASSEGGKTLGKAAAEGIGGSGNVVFIGGEAGNVTSALYMAGIKEALADYPDVHLVTDEPLVSNHNKVDGQKAVAGLLATNPDIDAVITDYGLDAISAISAFREAGVKIPYIAALATSNELACIWQDASTTDDKFDIFSIDGSIDMGYFAVRQGVAAANGIDYPRNMIFTVPTFWDSKNGANPECMPNLPPDADLSSPLTVDQLADLLK